MRRALQLLASSVLRSRRLGAAVVLAIVVFGIVGVARAVSGPVDDAGVSLPPAPTGPVSTVDPSAGDDGVAATAQAEPTAAAPETAAAEAVAAAFAAAWLRRDATAERWHAALVPHATEELARKLEGVDPVVVPAERLTGEPQIVPRGAGLLEVTYPVDSGELRLRVVSREGRWLVDGVDWERA